MNKDAEAINRFLDWLLQEPDPMISKPSGENSSLVSGSERFGTVDLQVHTMDPLDSEVEALQSLPFESSTQFTESTSSLELGELPAVQDRFHALIKRRLRAEIEQNPPLFPWETSLWDYESEPPLTATESIPSSLWTAQLQTLKLPIPIPQSVLLQIFTECRKVVQSSLREGVKLVRSVENLFPEDLQALNEMAGLVLATSPSRSGTAMFAANTLPASYESANATQQMLCSMLAARQMLEAMTLEVSADCPQVERPWLTEAGTLLLVARYQPETSSLQVQGQLPCSGRLSLQGETQQTTATQTGAGTLKLELGNLMPEQTCELEVELDTADRSTLVFTIRLIEEI
jgi:hypothetical protein